MKRAHRPHRPGDPRRDRATKDFPGVAGTISLDADHNAVKSAVVIGIDKNAPKYKATVKP